MNKLLSMTDFVLEQMDNVMLDGTGTVCGRIGNYANFLKQPLKLEMFAPINEKGEFFEQPERCDYSKQRYYNESKSKWFKAKEKVLFDGLTYVVKGDNKIVYHGEMIVWVDWNKSKTIESLIYHNLTLTESAIKQIGL